MIDILSSSPESARRWLADHRDEHGWTDISNSDWQSREVIEGVEFTNVRLVEKAVLARFVNCTFIDSEFTHLKVDGHFWGAGNRWTRCLFNDCVLRDMISPQNLFDACTIEGTLIEGYQPCETLFRQCQFASSRIRHLRTVPSQRQWTISEMATIGATLQFMQCHFERAAFELCAFCGSAFRGCTFVETNAHDCEFEGIDSDMNWWPDAEPGDLFISFLNQAVAEISSRLGPMACSAVLLEELRTRYIRGDSKTMDYSACLYDGRVPDEELDVVEGILDELGPRFGM